MELDLEGEQDLEQHQSISAAILKENHINQFSKLLRALGGPTRAKKIEFLVDCSQSQLLTSLQHKSNLKDIV